MSALSGLDQALWDLKGHVIGVPVWELMGGKIRERFRCTRGSVAIVRTRWRRPPKAGVLKVFGQ